jgi:hypothetical protein
MEDIFDMQENVSTKIVDALRMQLTSEEKQNLQKRFTEDSEAINFICRAAFSGIKEMKKH